jgi:hypothetical protein
MELKILDTDKFFHDSPNTGEPGCICSRCQRLIPEHEVPLRVAVDQEVLYAEDKAGKEVKKKVDVANGLEFRLCEACQKQIGIKIYDNSNGIF